jgi:hypothetical protein
LSDPLTGVFERGFDRLQRRLASEEPGGSSLDATAAIMRGGPAHPRLGRRAPLGRERRSLPREGRGHALAREWRRHALPDCDGLRLLRLGQTILTGDTPERGASTRMLGILLR